MNYPDPLANPDGDPREYQRQYEEWHRDQERFDREEEQQREPHILATTEFLGSLKLAESNGCSRFRPSFLQENLCPTPP